jgi:[acyl-carrier-protein] S-malonyltransferase
MTARTAVVFPGQGTQTPGMGAVWRDRSEWESVVGRAESALGEPLGRLLVDADADELLRTRNAQLAVLLTSLLAWEAISDRVTPLAFAGHSLGQVTALIAAGVMPFDDGVRFAAVRADRTQAAADATPGAMAALLGATLEQAEAGPAASAECWIANDNAPGQVVLAGTPSGLDAGIAAAKAAGARTARPLAVGGAFHTPLMQPAADALCDDLASVPLAAPTAPVVSNDDGEPYADGEGWRTRSAAHVAVPVRWRLVQTSLGALGADRLLEVGSGTMLAALAKRTIPDIPVLGIADPTTADELTDDA